MVTENRFGEVRNLLARLQEWAEARPDIVAVGVAGSWARGDARMGSDVDVVLLTEDWRPYLGGDAWLYELGGMRLVKTQQWGPVTERRFALPSGLEVEMGVVPPSWATTDPVDEGTRRVVTDGLSVVYDPQKLLTRLIDACGQK